MTKEARQAAYLEKARNAEEMAVEAADEATRGRWLKIAEFYRRLAKST